MKKIKSSSIAGFFYPAEKENLKNQIESFSKAPGFREDFSSRAVIVPHAGLVYSGELAYKGINLLDKRIKTIFIFAPAHKVWFEGLSVPSFDSFETPFGEIEINKEIVREIRENFGASPNDPAFSEEHSIEIQLPLIQAVFDGVKIVPVLIGGAGPELIEKIIAFYYSNPENGFVISSDLSHFLTDGEARKIDNLTARMIETGCFKGFASRQACGAVGILGLSLFSLKNNFSLLRVGLMNSSAQTGDFSRVVGYGSWVLVEREKNEFIKENYSDFVLQLCKKSIEDGKGATEVGPDFPEFFKEWGASFVTLEKGRYLRGCIGSILAGRPLIEDLVANAKNAAFFDPRFTPVKREEIPEIKIAVSLLSDPVPIKFSDEEDLLNQIRPYRDGIIIKDGAHQAVYLPSVWEQLPDKAVFLNSLKVKAGLFEDYFSQTLEAYRFETVYIKHIAR